MKKIYSTILCILTVGAIMTSSAQQQPNNGTFEDWDNEPEPNNWNNMTTGDLCFLCGFGASQRVFEDNSEFHGGTASARIESTDAAGTLVNGTMTTGQIIAPNTTPSEGHAKTIRSNSSFNHPFTDQPDSLVFWAKYNITDASDSATVAVILHDDNDYRDPNGDNSQVIGEARKRFQTAGTGSWVRISVPFAYTGASVNPVAYALMTFSSSWQPGVGNNTAKLWVDDFEFIYNPVNPTGIEELAEVVSVYPNPTNDGRVTVSFAYESLTGTASILNMMGQTVGMVSFSNQNRLEVNIDQPSGMYFINLQTEDGKSTTIRVVKN